MRAFLVPGGIADRGPLASWLQAREASVLRAPPGADARAVLETLDGEVDLVICDARRSAGGALELLARTRSRGHDVPFLLIVPGSAEEIDHDARRHGAAVCLPARALDAHSLDEAARKLLEPSRVRHSGAKPSAPPARTVRAAAAGARELAPALLWRAGSDGAFTQISVAWSRFTGRAADKELGSGWIAGLHAEDVDRWLEVYTNALATRRGFRVDLRLRRADGEYRWLRIEGVPRGAGGAFAGFQGSAFDVTDLVDGRAALMADVERLASANRDLEQFAYAAAHDLDEPLRTLERALQADESELAQAELARAGAARMRAMLRELLDCTLVGVANTPLEPVDLSTPLDWALENLKSRIDEQDARVTRTALPVVRCDPIQIARLFQNLIANAVKFRAESAPRIHVAATVKRHELLIRVADNGIGIPAEQHEQIFAPFKRAHPPGIAGSGIGLALCKRIVERHGGSIWVESEPDKGSTFSFTLKR